LYSIGSFTNLTKHRKYIDSVLKEELGYIYIRIPRFFEAFFRDIIGLRLVVEAIFNKCKEGDNLLY
ncbi:hypothetical protein BKA66DRAFT_434548, partial [Pyrenochaeta sp. MPI-SDFR-AT-0127]